VYAIADNYTYQYDDNAGWDVSLEASRIPLQSVECNPNNIIVAVGNNGLIKTSSDGVNWIIVNSKTKSHLNKVRYINGKFFAVGNRGTIISSQDGRNWSNIVSGVNANLKDIMYYNNKYYVVGDSTTILISDNGINWTKHVSEMLTNRDFVALETFKGELYLAAKDKLYSSNNGDDWTEIRKASEIRAIKANGDKLVLYYLDPDDSVVLTPGQYYSVYGYCASTSDGKEWVKTQFDQDTSRSLVWNGNQFVLYGSSAYFSTDGVKWNKSSISSNYDRPIEVVRYKDMFIGVSNINNGDNNIAKSQDALSWTTIKSGVSTQYYSDVVWGNNGFVVVGNQSTILHSKDGTKWEEANGGNGGIISVEYGPYGYVAAGVMASMYYSKNGDNWVKAKTPQLGDWAQITSVKWINDRYAAVDDKGEVITSVDGINWQKVFTLQVSNGFDGKIIDNNKNFVVYNYNYQTRITDIAETTDYINWRYFKYNGQINNIIYANGYYFALDSSQKKIVRSSELDSWETIANFNTSVNTKLFWDGSKFKINGYNKNLTSFDGVNWQESLANNYDISFSSFASNGVKDVAAEGGFNGIVASKVVTNELKPVRIIINGNSFIDSSVSDINIQYTGEVYDQNDNKFTGSKIIWEVNKNSQGITIDVNTGKLSVPKNTSKAKVYITAKVQGSNTAVAYKTLFVSQKSSVQLEANNLNLICGQTGNIHISTPLGWNGLSDYAFSSSNTAAATVNNYGTVKAIGSGRTTITITNLQDGTEAEFRVNVIAQEDVNGDGKVDIVDLSLVANNFDRLVGQDVDIKKYDLNSDGYIDIFDLVKVAKLF
jgi:photosystem II stability/assembly factor-like uncharacterized protein